MALLLRIYAGRNAKFSRYPYQRLGAWLSADERIFFGQLQTATEGRYEIFAKVQVTGIIAPNRGYSPKDARYLAQPLGDRHFDFVLCEKKTLAVVCAIELRDQSRASRQAPDPLPAICESIGLPWVVFALHDTHTVETINDKLHHALLKAPLSFQESDGRKEPSISNLDDLKF